MHVFADLRTGNAGLVIAPNTPLIATALMKKAGTELILIGGRIDRHAGLKAIHFDDAEFKRAVARQQGHPRSRDHRQACDGCARDEVAAYRKIVPAVLRAGDTVP